MNAYTSPIVGPYLDRAAPRTEASCGFGDEPLIMMQSIGGVIGIVVGGAIPVRMVESGPAAGALAAAYYGRGARARPAPLVRHGRHDREGLHHRGRRAARSPAISRSTASIASRRAAACRFLPSVDMIEIGAGGGSIARGRRARPAQGRPATARARARARLLRPRRQQPDGDRRRLVLGYLDRRQFPRRRHEARSRGGREAAGQARGGARHIDGRCRRAASIGSSANR